MVSYPDAGGSCLEIAGVSHFYGQKPALTDVSLEARQREVLALLGPSGSGKSTLLAAIAGMVKPITGKILLRGCDLLELPPESRGLGMVFQDYALWPHMTVAQNVAFPLRARRTAPGEVSTRVENALVRVGLQGFESRRPHELSGGQQQRVALARAVIAEPELLLLDEPLSALDPATRASVRGELAALLRNLGLTTIIVTHEREEAFELADRVAVLVDGRIQQHATPQEVYERPTNLAVARFMGVNLLSGQVCSDGSIELNDWTAARLETSDAPRPGAVHVVVVPEQTRILDDRTGLKNVVPGRLVLSQYRGGEYRLKISIGNTPTGQIIEARSKFAPGEGNVYVHLAAETIHVIPDSPNKSPTPVAEPATNIALTKLQEDIV
jgi:putative spermidine/putrescine transport system ATP-binding protein